MVLFPFRLQHPHYLQNEDCQTNVRGFRVLPDKLPLGYPKAMLAGIVYFQPPLRCGFVLVGLPAEKTRYCCFYHRIITKTSIFLIANNLFVPCPYRSCSLLEWSMPRSFCIAILAAWFKMTGCVSKQNSKNFCFFSSGKNGGCFISGWFLAHSFTSR